MSVTARGGYQIIDLAGYTISGTPTTVPGIFEKVKNSKKPILIENLKGANSDYTFDYAPIYPIFVPDGDGVYVALITEGVALTVLENDSVIYGS